MRGISLFLQIFILSLGPCLCISAFAQDSVPTGRQAPSGARTIETNLDHFYSGHGKGISFTCQDPTAAYAAKVVIYDGLRRLIDLNPAVERQIVDRLENWQTNVYCDPDTSASSAMKAVSFLAIALNESHPRTQTSKIHGSPVMGKGLKTLGYYLSHPREYDEKKDFEEIVWNDLNEIPTLLFHEFLHALGLDNQTTEIHNQGLSLKDSVYMCSVYAYPYPKWYMQEAGKEVVELLRQGCETCALVRKRHLKIGHPDIDFKLVSRSNLSMTQNESCQHLSTMENRIHELLSTYPISSDQIQGSVQSVTGTGRASEGSPVAGCETGPSSNPGAALNSLVGGF